MPIVLTQPYVPSVPSYDKIHLDNLSIALEKTNYSKTSIQARIRPYYQDPITGNKTFSSETKEIFIDDAEAWAAKLAEQGDIRGLDAGNHIRAIVALLVETNTNLGEALVQS